MAQAEQCPYEGMVLVPVRVERDKTGTSPDGLALVKEERPYRCVYVTGHGGEHFCPADGRDYSDKIRARVLRDRLERAEVVIEAARGSRDVVDGLPICRACNQREWPPREEGCPLCAALAAYDGRTGG